jgi:hypothetical protein
MSRFDSLFRNSESFWDTVDRVFEDGNYYFKNISKNKEDKEKIEPIVNGRVHGEVKYKDGRPSEWFWEGKHVSKDEYIQLKNKQEDNTRVGFTLNNKIYAITQKTYKDIVALLEKDNSNQ